MSSLYLPSLLPCFHPLYPPFHFLFPVPSIFLFAPLSPALPSSLKRKKTLSKQTEDRIGVHHGSSDRLLGRAQEPGSAHSTDSPPQFNWEAITLTSWHSLHSSWVCFFARANWWVRQVKKKRRRKWRKCLKTASCCLKQQLGVLNNSDEEQLAQEKCYFDMQKIYNTWRVLYPSRDLWKKKKT